MPHTAPSQGFKVLTLPLLFILNRQGPFPESTLIRMLVKKLPGLDTSSFCWTPGMEEWRPIGQMTNFSSVLEAESAAWYYLDKNGQQQGPTDVKNVADLLHDGEVDGLSLVWHQDLAGGWRPLSEVDELRQLLRLFMPSELGEEQSDKVQNIEPGSGAKAGGGADLNITMDERQVFQAEEMPGMSMAVTSTNKKTDDGGVKQSYVADDGTKYRLNIDTNEWEEVESDDESEDEMEKVNQEGNDEPSQQNCAASSTEYGTLERRKRKKKNRGGEGWDRASNKWVYITGLPSDATAEELEAHFKQVGILAIDPETQRPRIKMYRDPSGAPKGDASVAFVRPESVELAVEILNEGMLRPGWPLNITKAVFHQKASTAGEKSKTEPVKKRRLNEAKAKVARAAAKQALSWSEADDSGLGGKALRIVVVKNMFEPSDCESAEFIEDLRKDLEIECTALGPLEKMTIFERHPEGVIVIKFGTAFAAEQCVKLMNGRFFAGRKLQSFYWDGSTDYTKANYKDRQTTTRTSWDHGKVTFISSEGNDRAYEGREPTEFTLAEDGEDTEEEKRLADFGAELDNQDLPEEFQLEVASE